MIDRGNFNLGNQLTPNEVYCTIIGAAQHHGFELVNVFKKSDKYDPSPELGRVYKEKNNNEHFIIFFPGKDNKEPPTRNNSTTPLKEIYTTVSRNLQDQPSKIKNAKQLFIVCESNTYLFFVGVKHFVAAYKENGVLTIEDSMNRSYNEGGIKEAIESQKVISIKRGWQGLGDSWQCGHYTIAALIRKILNLLPPEQLIIDQTIIDNHFNFYQKGVDNFRKQNAPENNHKITNIDIDTEATESEEEKELEDEIPLLMENDESHQKEIQKVSDNNCDELVKNFDELVQGPQKEIVNIKVLNIEDDDSEEGILIKAEDFQEYDEKDKKSAIGKLDQMLDNKINQLKTDIENSKKNAFKYFDTQGTKREQKLYAILLLKHQLNLVKGIDEDVFKDHYGIFSTQIISYGRSFETWDDLFSFINTKLSGVKQSFFQEQSDTENIIQAFREFNNRFLKKEAKLLHQAK